jgi:hypothetical protein
MPKKYKFVSNPDRDDYRSHLSFRSINEPQQLPVSPLYWWRTRRPRTLGRREVKAIRVALLREAVNDVDWLLAVTGDPAAAIGVAVRHMHTYGMTSPIIDVVISAACCCAIEGNHAAKIVVSSALRRRKEIDPPCHELCLLWRAARF